MVGSGPCKVCIFYSFYAADFNVDVLYLGWAYMFIPTTKIHQMPYTELIDLLRTLLTDINIKAMDMERKWLYDSLVKEENSKKEKSVGRPAAGSSSANICVGYLTNQLFRPPSDEDKLRSAAKQERKYVPVHPDLVRKIRLVELQKARAKKVDLAAASTTSEMSSSASKPQTKHPGNAQDENQQASSELSSEELPSKILAGKPPAIWKQELMSSLSLLVGPELPEPQSTDQK